jgi:hypothetical protein
MRLRGGFGCAASLNATDVGPVSRADGTDPAAQARFLASMSGWLGKARAAGLDPGDIEAIYRTDFPTCCFAKGVA